MISTRTASRRDAILAGALHCFTRQGFDETTIEDIRHESGASIGSIYHHFNDKAGIAAAVYAHAVRSYQTSARPVVERAALTSTEAAIKQGVIHYVTWAAENEELARFLLESRQAQSVPATAEVRELVADFIASISEWLIDRQRQGELKKMNVDVAIALWNGPAREYTRAWMARPADRPPLSDAAPTLAAAAWRSLRP